MLVLVMGVSGTGKSTIGQSLAQALGLPFFEGDDFHPQANRDKMASGFALNDDDRRPWLLDLAQVLAKAAQDEGGILACSALKEQYRQLLQSLLPSEKPLHIVALEGSFEVLFERLNARKDHFFPPQLLQSQLDTYESPSQAIHVDVKYPAADITRKILLALRQN